MDVFHMLSPSIQRLIWRMKWERFYPIQERAIPMILHTDQHVVLSSETATGKTEAAFLPILSLVETSAKSELNVLYVSPLKALINDQFERIEKLCEQIQVAVHKWHGDVAQNLKEKFIKKPTGILQITPESLESLFINRTQYLPRLFGHIRFIVIDEIHAFLDSARGVQLRSLLGRMDEFCLSPPRIVGLSATLGDVTTLKKWVNPRCPDRVEVVQDKSIRKDLRCWLIHRPRENGQSIPIEIFEDMREITRDAKSILFCNARSEVEETTVFLNRLAEREGVGESYLAHHSAIDKKERERVEAILARASDSKSVVSTSTLELGIDIGTIDLVVQLDSTFTVSSLKQRLGRCGRREDAVQMLQLYTTSEDSLLQSIAVMELLREGWIEPFSGYPKPYDVVFHQILSICHQKNGISSEELVDILTSNAAFFHLDKEDLLGLIDHMVETDMLEVVRGTRELIVGITGERILRSKDFYTVFITSEEYTVLHGHRPIGRLDKAMPIQEDDNVILAGRLWKVNQVDVENEKIYVVPAADAKPPKFFGGPRKLHRRIPEKMFEILCSAERFPYIDHKAAQVLEMVRQKYRAAHVRPEQRVYWSDNQESLFESFTGTVIADTLFWMMRSLDVPIQYVDRYGRITFRRPVNLDEVITQLRRKTWTLDELYAQVSVTEHFRSKYSPFLPQEHQKQMHLAHEVDLEGAMQFLDQYECVTR